MEPSTRHHAPLTTPRGAAGALRPIDPTPGCLSPRERAVVLALCEGLDRRAIARRIRRSRSTFDKTICAIYRSTGFGTAHQVVAWAFRVGLVHVATGVTDEHRR